MRGITTSGLILLTITTATGCASLFGGGPRQAINVSSVPTGATVLVDGDTVGTTPRTMQLARVKGQRIVRIELAGYQPYEIEMTRGTNGWFWANLIAPWWVLGLVVDVATGSMFKLTPQQVSARLAEERVSSTDGTLYIGVTLTPDPAWEKVGALTPVDRQN